MSHAVMGDDLQVRLLSIEVSGLRRLLDCKCHLGGKVTAIVGPNEAGKSTLLLALKHINTNEAIPTTLLSRVRRPDDDDVIIAADWELDESDLASLAEWDLERPPVRLRIEKKGTGKRLIEVTPKPSRKSAIYESALTPLQRFLESGTGKKLPRADPDDEDASVEVGDDLDWIVNNLSAGRWTKWDDDDIDRSTRIVDSLAEMGGSSNSLAAKAAASLRQVVVTAKFRDPVDVWRTLLGRVPVCVEFSQVDRNLLSSYQLDALDLDEPPQALANLVDLAELDLQDLVNYVNDGDRGMAATVLRNANARLATFYGERWRQSELHVVLDRDGLRLDILIEESGGGTYVLNERSDGLRAFVALTAFLARHDLDRPVLLIDEAETHLHYDAQRDLVDVLIEQEVAQQVVYTTHSPGCLPPDLGTGIRAVVPVKGRPGVSTILNQFWSADAPGFSPLLLMMGAAAAAFTTTRSALLVEGPSDMILLPSLLRLALGQPTLPYHVAPGLSTTAPDRYTDFDLVAARLVYVVDGDAGGQSIRVNLTARGIPDDRILALNGHGSGATLEDLVSQSTFVQAVNDELTVTHQSIIGSVPNTLGRYSVVRQACEAAGLQMPSKVAIAGRLVWNIDRLELAPTARRILLKLHREAAQRLE